MVKTKPKPTGIDSHTNPCTLVAGRYGTKEMINIWGPEKTFEYCLRAQSDAVGAMSYLYPESVPENDAREIKLKANLKEINPNRIRELEELTGHDVIAINTALGEQVSDNAAAHINKGRTSADTTETAKAMQLKKSIEVIADSLENLRDITLERSVDWMNIPHMDTTHLYDALPTVLGRPFAHYGEMLQSDLEFLDYVYNNSIKGKWGDATGNHHSATALKMNGKKLEKLYCEGFCEVGHMMAPAQIPGREFIADCVYALARSSETLGNLAHYIRMGRSDDVGIFKFPMGDKGSSAMPHKDAKGGNPRREEQTEGFTNYMRGVMQTTLGSCGLDYGRDLRASATDRITLEESFKWGDYVIRNLAKVLYVLEAVEDRCRERVERSYGVPTSQQVMTYLTDRTRTENPMTREYAHDLVAKLATEAYDAKRPFVEIVLENKEITDLLPEDTLRNITDPIQYIGQSKEIIGDVYANYHGKKTFKGRRVDSDYLE